MEGWRQRVQLVTSLKLICFQEGFYSDTEPGKKAFPGSVLSVVNKKQSS